MEKRRYLSSWIYALLSIWFVLGGIENSCAITPDDYQAAPVIASTAEPPLVMIVMGRDHKLYFEAYNDASDLDDDGTLDLHYDPDIDYYGYFDSYKVYTYSTSNERFEPVRETADKTVNASATDEWSGDYLNYLTMSRMDCLRKVLYGGYRSTDGTSETVLERAYIPRDSHTWGKEYSTSDDYDIEDYTPLEEPTNGYHLFACTSLCDPDDSSYQPLLRVLEDRSERIWDWVTISFREGIAGSLSGTAPTDYVVKVLVGTSTLPEDNCKLYTDSSGNSVYKPIGLLQRYGEPGKMLFGLITGSYANNWSGGVLRKNIGEIEDEINPDTGQFYTSVNGIIQTIDRLRLVGLDYSKIGTQLKDPGYLNCVFTDEGRTEGECAMWGNPIGEMMYETLRYFSGTKSPTTNYTYGSSEDCYDNDLGLNLPDWEDPYTTYPSCSKPFMLVISDVNPSYDSDQLPGSSFDTTFSGDISGLDVEDEGDTIGDAEIGSSDYFIGVADSDADEICTPKDIDGFGDIQGLCPEESTKEGSYYSASVAYYGHKTDLRSSLGGEQKVETFAVGLASPLPEIKITVGTGLVTLVPYGKSIRSDMQDYDITADGDFHPTNAIVDFYVTSLGPASGEFRINFEDMEEGADYDMDSVVLYTYQVVDSDGVAVQDPTEGEKVKITVTAEEASGSILQHTGYIISGTTEDRAYLVIRDAGLAKKPNDDDYEGDTPLDSNGDVIVDANGDVVYNDGVALDTTATKTFTPASTGNGAALLLDTPLWYAGKWGGYENDDGDDTPDETDEWDADGDGVPDNYFYVTNATELDDQLNNAFEAIAASTASGTSSSVLATTNDGDGTLYQAYFKPSIESQNLTWVGYLNALWMDKEGNIRMESGTNKYQLNPSEDPVITFFMDEDENKTRVHVYDVSSDMYPDTETATYIDTIDLEDITPIWEAGTILAGTSAGDRKIYTSNDTSTGIDFSTANIDNFKYYLGVSDVDVSAYPAANISLLGSDLDTRATNLVSYIRGNDIDGLRNRTVDSKVWKLGDIIYSTPVSVAGAVESYHKVYADESYGNYVDAQSGRMTVVYAGANDGMLHAFAGGYYDEDNMKFETGTDVSTIGQELWAYIPRAVLPHLKWLSDPGYSHTYYVDLMPKIFDAKLDLDADGNAEWGTFLLLGLNMGGNDIDVELDLDGDGTAETDETIVPTYTLIDITNPTTPNILWEKSYTEMGMSRSVPTIIKVGGRHWVEGTTTTTGGWADDNDPHWMAVFGSGPHGEYAYEGYSDQEGHIYAVDLETGKSYDSSGAVGTDYLFSTDDYAVINWPENLDQGLTYEVNSVYFAESISDESGRVWSFDTYDQTDDAFKNKEAPIYWPVSDDPADWNFHLLLDEFPTSNEYGASGSIPAITAPLNLGADDDGNIWLYFGTGKFVSDSDKKTSDSQYLFGLKDPLFNKARNYGSDNYGTTTAVAFDFNSSGGFLASNFYWVYTDESVRECSDYSTCASYTALTEGFDTLLDMVRWDNSSDTEWQDGWFRELKLTSPSERCISEAAILGGGVFVAGFTPDDSDCSLGGTSRLYGLYYETGTAYFNPLVGSASDGLAGVSVDLGEGTPPTTTGFTPNGEEIVTQLSTGEVEETDADPAFKYKSRITNWYD
jgi:type IV pilus assembly protein PilY1